MGVDTRQENNSGIEQLEAKGRQSVYARVRRKSKELLEQLQQVPPAQRSKLPTRAPLPNLHPNPHPNSQDRSRRGSKDRNSSRESSRHSKHGASDRGEGSGGTAYLDSSPSGSEAPEVLAAAATAAKPAAAAAPPSAAKPAAVERQQSTGTGLAAAMDEVNLEASRTPRVRAG